MFLNQHKLTVPRRQSGISLLEMMISLMILAVGLLGLAAMQSRSMMMNQSAHYRSVAADLAADLADRIRANRSPYLASTDAASAVPLPPSFATDVCPKPASGTTTFTCTQPSVGGVARNAYNAAADLAGWYALLQASLPGGDYSLTSADAGGGALRYTLTITWNDDRSASTVGTFNYITVIE